MSSGLCFSLMSVHHALSAGHSGLDSLQALQGQLTFGSLFPHSTELTQAVENALSGDILLLCPQSPPPCSTHPDVSDKSLSLLDEDDASAAALMSCLRGSLQHCRLTGCLQ